MSIITLSPETAYASKPNIVFPGSTAQANAAEAAAVARINAARPQQTVTAATIKRGN
jgi:hypothetical protein